MTELKIVFAGSPAAAVPSLRALAASRHEIAAVITRENSPQGRGRVITPTAVGAAADGLGLPIIRANRLREVATAAVSDIAPDLGVIVAYGGLVREPLLSLPRLGWINLHFSLLPHWRGAAPVQHAIISGDELTGASVFQLVPELDAGDLFGTLTQSVRRDETAGQLLDSLSLAGAELLLRVVEALACGTASALPQEGEVSLAPKLGLDDGRIRFTEPAPRVHNRLRGVTPEPGAFALVDGSRLKLLDAVIARDAARLPAGEFLLDGRRLLVGTLTDPLQLVTVQPSGKKPMAAADWWRGRPNTSGTVAQ